jgi:hypothetical protein
VSTIDEKRIGHELIKTQWDGIDSDEEESPASRPTEGMPYIPTAILARQLVSASKIAGTVPIFVLPCIDEGNDHNLFEYLNSLGLRYHSRSHTGPIIDDKTVYPPRVALDITTLLSLVADICNMPPHSIEYERNSRAQVEQVESEACAASLPGAIYPYLQNADELITPPGVISKIHTLLETIGSDTEKQRAAIILQPKRSDEDKVKELGKLTIYQPSPTLPLPVKVIPVARNTISPLTEEEAEKLSPEAKEIYDLAISLSGGCEVATANKQLAKMVRAYYFVEQNSLGVNGRVLLHQPRSLRGYGKIVHQHREA